MSLAGNKVKSDPFVAQSITAQPAGTFKKLLVANRWPEIARCYAEVNQLFGDIVKVGRRAMTIFTVT